MSLGFHRALFRVGAERGGEKFVGDNRFIGRDAAEAIAELAFAFRGEGSPHLQEAIGKARFEDSTGDDG